MFSHIYFSLFQRLAEKYFKVHPEIKLVIVAGSIGKTTVKHAIGTVLAGKYRVRMHEGELHRPIDVFLALFGIMPPRQNGSLSYWLKAIRAARYQIKHAATVDVVVQELVLDRPGAVHDYEIFLNPDVAIITSVEIGDDIALKSLDAVAAEELATSEIAKYVLINRDDIPSQYASLEQNPNFNTYGTTAAAEYRVELIELDQLHAIPAELVAPEIDNPLEITVNLVGEHQMRPLAAAAAVGFKLGLTGEEVKHGLGAVTPLPGRLQPLRGLEDTIVLDDTWRIDVDTTVADLQTLYQFDSASERIAVIGSIDYLGDGVADGYKKIGEACSGNLLAWLVTVGETSAKYLTPLARRNGCQVQNCRDAIEAAKFVRSVSEVGSVILVKGGETDLLEEAVKQLVETSEHHRLVRQERVWLNRNAEIFSQFTDQ